MQGFAIKNSEGLNALIGRRETSALKTNLILDCQRAQRRESANLIMETRLDNMARHHTRMETIGTLFLIWFAHAAIGAVLSAPILFFGRKRVGWARWEWLALIIPFCVWMLLMLSPLSTGRKSLANLGEPVYISFAMPVLALVRVAIGTRITERVYAASFISALCVIAAAVFFMVPFKPE